MRPAVDGAGDRENAHIRQLVQDAIHHAEHAGNRLRFRSPDALIALGMIALGAVRPSACRAAERAPQASPTPVRDIVEASYRRLLQIMGSEASSEKHLLEHWYRDAVTCATTSAAATSAVRCPVRHRG